MELMFVKEESDQDVEKVNSWTHEKLVTARLLMIGHGGCEPGVWFPSWHSHGSTGNPDHNDAVH